MNKIDTNDSLIETNDNKNGNNIFRSSEMSFLEGYKPKVEEKKTLK